METTTPAKVRETGSGWRFAYTLTPRHAFVRAESLEVARLCVCPTGTLVRASAMRDGGFPLFVFAR